MWSLKACLFGVSPGWIMVTALGKLEASSVQLLHRPFSTRIMVSTLDNMATASNHLTSIYQLVKKPKDFTFDAEVRHLHPNAIHLG